MGSEEQEIIDALQPEPNWGVIPRNRKLSDYRKAFKILAFIPLVVFGAGLLLYMDFSIGYLDGWSVGISVLSVMVITFLYQLGRGWNKAGNEAISTATERAIDWQLNVLAPYLKDKYDFKFIPPGGAGEIEDDWLRWEFTGIHPEYGPITVKLHGVEWEKQYNPGIDCDEEYLAPIIPHVYEEPTLTMRLSRPKAQWRELEPAAI